MSLREDILNPIPGDNPSGVEPRSSPLYNKIKEARRADDDLPQGDWQRERKSADHAAVVQLAQEMIAKQSKDLQLAAWLTESLVKTRGYAGLCDGVMLCRDLLERFWDTVYPVLDEDGADGRANQLGWLGSQTTLIKEVPLCEGGYNYLQYTGSRRVPYEEAAKGNKQVTASRNAMLKDGRLAPELWDKSYTDTKKLFYAETEKALDSCLRALDGLDAVCGTKFEVASAPSFDKMRSGLEQVRHEVQAFLKEKRKTDPDPEPVPEPVVVAAPAAADEVAPPAGEPVAQPQGMAMVNLAYASRSASEPAGRGTAISEVAAAAALLRKLEPFSPAPYLMLRGLRWGELRASSDPAVLEAPPTDIRRQLKALALSSRWAELLEAAENVMALPCGRAWLDLQRLVVEACVALGTDYDAIAIAIRSELRALLADLPQLQSATLADETPAANPETQAWLRELLAEPAGAAPHVNLPRLPVFENGVDAGWHKKFIDPYVVAKDALQRNQPQQAFEALYKEVERQRSGRGRFQRKLQLAQICIAAGKDAVAQPLLDDLAAAIDTHKLDEWEDREMVAAALSFLMQNSKKIQSDPKVKQVFFERICRLDPKQAFLV